MANSIRQQVMIAVVSSLTNVSTDNDKFPALFPIDTDETKEAFTFRDSATAQDMKSTLTVLVTSYLYSRTGVTVQARSDLLRDVEKAMMNATAMTTISNIVDIRPMKVTTDQGTIENYSIHDQEFQIDYTYNHADGG